jgi:hypothetical protein
MIAREQPACPAIVGIGDVVRAADRLRGRAMHESAAAFARPPARAVGTGLANLSSMSFAPRAAHQ